METNLIGPAHPGWEVRRSVDTLEVDRVNVLDRGYVRLVDSMGNDLSVVNAARVSYDKESQEFEGRDDRLLKFLVRENHTAPFRHGIVQFEAYAPLFVARQWWKHIIGSQQNLDPYLAWNESSRRYVTEHEEFYVPANWRAKPDNNKQGSAGHITDAEIQQYFTGKVEESYEYGLNMYHKAMEMGIAPEQARLFLPANGLYVRWRWTTSLQGAMHFIALRDEAHAQWEIQEYARAVKELVRTKFPACIGGMDEH